MKWLSLRRQRLAESHAAIERQEQLGRIIDKQRAEAAEMGAWARERIRANHLTELFLTTRGGHR